MRSSAGSSGMASFSVVLKPSAEKDLRSLPKPLAKRLWAKIEALVSPGMMSMEPPHPPHREHEAGSFPLLWLFGLTAAALALRMVFLTTKALWFDETVSVF